MDKLNFYKITLYFLFFSLAGQVHAQNKITVKANTDKNKILIGERIHLTLEVVYPANTSGHSLSVDSIPHFIIIGREKTDTTKTLSGISVKQELQLTSFDSGHWVIPSFAFDKKIKTDPIPVDVVFSDFDSTKEYHDIKDIIELPKEKDQNWWYPAGYYFCYCHFSYGLAFKKEEDSGRCCPDLND